ncbi:hypothetical protein FSP39_010666 [Pinctada imbricata]|uniref:Usherin n=1 Tax=Pinctada imbricata TaxID=66713 RepID=A0AA89BW68_PINIB|nr:hypothetical protein FSP39_010666 [Pinctada imbricata]
MPTIERRMHYDETKSPNRSSIASAFATVEARLKQQLAWANAYQSTLSFYVNDILPGFSPLQTFTLVSPIQDRPGSTRIGQSSTGGNQFIGRVQDFKFFQVTLSNREVQALYSGVLPSVRIQTKCRCPPSHPRVKPSRQHYCIRNGVPDSDVDDIPRLNTEAHNLEYLNDGDTDTIWISKFQREVFLTLDLGDDYQVFYVVLQFYSPMPKAVLIERQLNGSDDWNVWQMYAEDCLLYFSHVNNGPLATPQSVNCIQFGTGTGTVPFSNGNITFSLLSSDPVPRPNYNDFYGSPELQDFVKASKVRVKLQDHYHVQYLRHEYFGLYEVDIKARCDCHGHAVYCDTSVLPYVCNCTAESFTQGNKVARKLCNRCQPLYNNKPFRRGDQVSPNNCVMCQCHGHADSCVYNASLDLFPDDAILGGGGVCQNCQHNTTGAQCDTCIHMHYRPVGKSKFDKDVCRPCSCYTNGIVDSNMDCEKDGGQCYCKKFAAGRACDSCAAGYFNLQGTNPEGCQDCGCETGGTVGGSKDCHINAKCDACEFGFYNLSSGNPKGCSPCECHPQGSTSQFCDPVSGQCQCKDHVTGRRCDRCADGFQNFDKGCNQCQCDVLGTVPNTVCDHVSGQCVCKGNVQGLQCNECKEGTFGFGNSPSEGCTQCLCDLSGTVNGSLICDKDTGNCLCKTNVEGKSCNRCKGNTYGLSADNDLGCDPCDCDPTGTEGGDTDLPQDLSCDQNTGACSCLAKRLGRRCETCEDHYFIFPAPGGGCQPCGCSFYSTIPLTHCDTVNGQCQCQDNVGVTGRTCSTCQVGFFNFNARQGKCTECECDTAGSVNDTCHSTTGQCACKQFVRVRRCDTCKDGTSFLDPENPYGCSKDPAQQPPPEFFARSPTAISLKWRLPDYPNGIIVKYRLFRNGTLVFSGNGTDQTYNDTELLAYTLYTYIVESNNDFGSTRSPPVTFRTLPGPPTGIVIVEISNILPTSAMVTWTLPAKLNGPLANYTVMSRSAASAYAPLLHWTGVTRGTNISELVPFMNYTITVVTCSTGGCLDSLERSFLTKSSLPAGMAPPKVTMLSSSKLLVKWEPPTQANGIIIFYELWMRGELKADGSRDPQGRRIFNPSGQYNPRPTAAPQENVLPPPVTNYTISGLDPFTVYEFQVLAENDIGKTASSWVAGRTGEALPIHIAPPDVNPITSSELVITWTAPSDEEARGVISTYNIYHNQKSDLSINPFSPPYIWKLIATAPGSMRTHRVNNLMPFTNYTYMLEACNSVGCVNSTEVTELTLQDVPQGIGKPKAHTVNSTVIEITWHEPSMLNGPQPLYSVEKTIPSLSFPPIVTPGIRFKFRTRKSSSLLFFAASAGKQEEFIAIQFRTGRPWFLFDPQGCPSFVTPTNDEGLPYNDYRWHRLLAMRTERLASISIDSYWKGTREQGFCDSSTGTVIGRSTGVYIGGIPPDFTIRREDTDHRLLVTRESFMGCIKDIEILTQMYPTEVWTPVDWNQAQLNEQSFQNWEGCPENLEHDGNAVHFLGEGYVSVPGTVWEMYNQCILQFMFRSDLASGVLFFAHGGDGIYFFVALVRNTLYFEFSDGTATGSVSYQDPNVRFCDGEWYTVTMDKKGQRGRIYVQDHKLVSSGDENYNLYIKTISDLYIGGVPENSVAMQFIEENNINIPRQGFGGCLKDIKLTLFFPVFHSKTVVISDLMISLANVNMDGCSPFVLPEETCKGDLVQNVYNGTDLYYVDAGLQPYSDYLYRVSATNDGGTGSSLWRYARTKEGAPQGVKPPYNVTVLSGYVIEARWESPISSSGLLSKYILRAYSLDEPSLAPVESEFTNLNRFQGKITTAIPYTNYSVRIAICTGGGCSESTGVHVITLEEAPENVDPPAADAGVYTAYQFMIRVCTRVGCTDSPSVSLLTAQLPPSYVKPPVVLALDTTRVEVRWEKPDQLNGELERYLLYVSTDNTSVGAIVYESNDFFTNNIITHLVAGTTYYISLGTCTAGGCTTSNYSIAITKEGVPEGVLGPTLSSKSPSELTVSWTEPTLPNGNILRYTLYHNEVRVYSGLNMTFTITRLKAYSLQTVRLEVCTIKGCGSSTMVTGRTKEAPPVGFVVIDTKVKDARTVEVKWSPPAEENGIIFYDVFFDGNFYADPDSFNYTLIKDRRSMFRGHNVSEWVMISPLVPVTHYMIQVNASNQEGYVLSNILTANMPEGTPDGVIPPMLISETVHLYLSDVESCSIFGPTTTFLHTKQGLKPYTRYEFRIKATNSHGSSYSPWAKQTTRQDKPESFDPPLTGAVGSKYVDITWLRPLVTNGVIKEYKIYQNNKYKITVNGNNTSVRVEGLTPFTPYTFSVEACTMGGCRRTGESATVRTLEDVPEGLATPALVSLTPTSVEIKWAPVNTPNGIINEYIIERRRNGTQDITDVGKILPTENLIFIDESPEISPFTTYEYRVKVTNGAGSAFSSWHGVTTKSTRPAGVMPPGVNILGPTSMTISWQPPLKMNGILEYYVIRLPLPQTELRNISILSLTVYNLTAYTMYNVTMTACTDGGCTESVAVPVRTDPTVPEGQSPPVPSVMSQTLITLTWQPPKMANGPNVRFELARMKLKQPLEGDVTDLNLWRSLYTGTGTYYEDRGLPIFTRFIYRITVYNDVGQLTSEPCNEVTTYGGFPRRAAEVTVIALSHISLKVSWITPNVTVLQGSVSQFTLLAWSRIQNVTKTYPSGTYNATVSNLIPNTDYYIRLTITVHGGESITSLPMLGTTLDGAPEGVHPPSISILSETSVRISWSAPDIANGEITGYSIYTNDVRTPTNMVVPGSYVLTNLLPYTVYSIQVEVCTVFDCTFSDEVLITTAEALPQGLTPPTVVSDTPTSVDVTWTEPTQPNGILLRYDLFRTDN